MLKGKYHDRGIFWIPESNSQYPSVNDHHHQLGGGASERSERQDVAEALVYSKALKLSKGIPDAEAQYGVFYQLNWSPFPGTGALYQLH